MIDCGLDRDRVVTGHWRDRDNRGDIIGQQFAAVAFVADVDHLEDANLPEELKSRIINGYNQRRSGPITFILDPGWYSGTANGTGTTHSSWNAYDAHIPLLWMGWGIKKGSTNRQVNMSDITPTLAGLLHIQMPNGCIGRPVEEVYKK